jgi:hypothetical protein
MPIVVMIMIVPVPLVVPTMFVLVPPAVTVIPAPLPGFVEFVSPVVRLSAVVTVPFDGFIQLVVCVNQLSLAIVACIRSRRTCQQHAACKHGRRAGESYQAHFPSTRNHNQLPPSSYPRGWASTAPYRTPGMGVVPRHIHETLGKRKSFDEKKRESLCCFFRR